MDDGALARIFDERYGLLVGLARLLRDDPEPAAATVHEAFAHVLHAAGGSDPVEERVRRAVVHMSGRRVQRSSVRAPADEDEMVVLDEERRRVVDAVRSLSRRQREAVVQRFFLHEAPPDVTDIERALTTLAKRLGPEQLVERLARELGAEAGTAQPDQVAWDDVLRREAAIGPRRRRRAIVAVASALVVTASAAGAFVATRPPSAPPFVLVVSADGVLQIRRTTDGEVVRTVRRDIEPSRAPVAASPDGGFAYVDQPDDSCAGGRVIERIDLSTGRTTIFGPGRSPTFSNDGTRLAFATATDECDVFDTLVIRDLGRDHELRFPASAERRGWQVTYLRWSADDQRIAYTVLETYGYSNRSIPANTVNGARLDRGTLRDIAIDGEPIGYLDDGRVLVLSSRDGTVSMEVVGGEESPPVVIRDDVSIDIGAIGIDRSRTHVLWIERPEGERTTRTPGDLMRLRIGDDEPVRVARGVTSASWLPHL